MLTRDEARGKIAAMAHPLAEILAVIAPPGCVSCRAPTAAGERLCPSCTRALPWLRRACPRCALPSHRGRTCPASAAAFDRAWAPMAYEGVARDLVAALKFRAALGVADLMAAHMAANLPATLRGPTTTAPPPLRTDATAARPVPRTDDAAARPVPRTDDAAAPAVPRTDAAAARPLPRIDAAGPWPRSRREDAARLPAHAPPHLPAIVPVPTVSARRRRRGFDPAGVLAEALARRLERPLVACLQRRDRAPRQVGSGRRARREPGRLVFAARNAPPLALLVDDVHTTGATFDAAARALAAAGTTVVAALSYARTL